MSTELFSPGFSRIVKADATLEKISGGHIFTEGPVWNGKENFLVWTDIIGDTIWKWIPGQGTSIIMRPSGKADGMTYDHEGRLLVAGWSSRTVWRWEHDGSTTVLAFHVDGKNAQHPQRHHYEGGRHRLFHRPVQRDPQRGDGERGRSEVRGLRGGL